MSLIPSPRQSFLYFILCTFGLVVAFGAILVLLIAMTTSLWPVAHGKLIGSSVRKSESSNSRTYSPQFTYEYTVNGRPYVGFFTRLGGMSFSYEPNAEQYVARKRKEAIIPVYYLPLFPSVAVMERGASEGMWIIAGAGIAFFLGFRLLAEINARRLPVDS